MQLTLNEQQTLLQQSAAGLFRERGKVGRIRALRDARDAVGFSRELWTEMAQLVYRISGDLTFSLSEGPQRIHNLHSFVTTLRNLDLLGPLE